MPNKDEIRQSKAMLYAGTLDQLIKIGSPFSTMFSELLSQGMDGETALFKCHFDLIVKPKIKYNEQHKKG